MAMTVTKKLKAILADQKEREALGTERVLSILEELRRQIVAELVALPAGTYSTVFLQSSLASIERLLTSWEASVHRELGGFLSSSWSAGESMLSHAAEAAGMNLRAPMLSSHILDALKQFAFGRISAVRGDLYNRIKGELTLGVLGQKTPQEVAGQLAQGLAGVAIPKGRGGHPIFKSAAERSEVITGLEMGRAFSMATQKSIEVAKETVPELQSLWLHAGHPRAPRQSHLFMHGQTRAPGKPFYRTEAGAPVYYPRDPDAPISETIRCGCTHIPWHPDWGTAESFAQSFDSTQVKVNQPRGAK